MTARPHSKPEVGTYIVGTSRYAPAFDSSVVVSWEGGLHNVVREDPAWPDGGVLNRESGTLLWGVNLAWSIGDSVRWWEKIPATI